MVSFKLPRSIITLFLIILSLGYIAAIINLYLTHRTVDLHPALTPNDIRTHFHGDPGLTRLTVMINTEMRHYLNTEEEKKAIESWIAAGSTEPGYMGIRHIFQNRCIRCHDLFEKAEFAPLTTYKEVTKYTEPFNGVDWNHIARLSHQHLFGMGLLFGSVAFLLLRTGRNIQLKTGLIALACIAVIADVGGWSLTKLQPEFTYLVIAGGMLHGLCFATIAIWILCETWRKKQ